MLRKIAKKIYRFIIPAPPAPRFDSSHSRTWWATRDDAADVSSASGYWDNRSHPARRMVAEAIAELSGGSLLEIGVHAGPTMWAICQLKKFERLAGTELSETVLKFTRSELPKALGQEVELIQASADRLPFPDKSFDIVVTNLVFSCIGPEHIDKSLDEMVRVAARYIVMGEPDAASGPEREDLYPNTTYWIRNYAERLKGRVELVKRITVPKESQYGHLNEIAVFKVL